MKNVRQILVLAPVFSVLFGPSLWSQQSGNGPALGVARVSLTKGDVTVQRGDSGDSIQARANMPLVEGDILTTGLASRAEIQLDYSNLFRLNEHSQVRVASLGNRSFRLQVERGIVTYSELRGGDADVDIETPLVAVRPEKNGRYRVQVVDVNEVIVTVQKGKAEVASANGREELKKNRRMIVRGSDQGVEFQLAKAEPKDAWDDWNVRRDGQLKQSNAYRYVSRSIYGAEDLDGYGRWEYVPAYGRCWFPSVGVGWAPYRHGRWVWLDHYGWSWVSYDSWGWAPYHYGRWFHHAGFGWGWYPGSYYRHHYWQPALVAFFGYSSHHGYRVGLGLNFGHYGWIPLAPGEPYYPWYGHRYRGRSGFGGHHNSILVDNSVNIYNNYRNARHRNGVTLVDSRDFARGRLLKARSLQASELRRASLMRGRIPVVPDRTSQGQIVRSGGRPGQGRAATAQNGFYSRSRSNRNVTRSSFTQQRQEIASAVRSFGLADRQGDPRAKARSSSNPRRGRSAANSPTRTGTAARKAPNSLNNRSSRSRAGSAVRQGRSVIEGNPGRRANPSRSALPSGGGSTARSEQSWKRFDSRQSGSRTSSSRRRPGPTVSNSPRSRSNSSRSVRNPRSSGPSSNSRATDNLRGRSSGSSGSVQSSRSSRRVSRAPASRFEARADPSSSGSRSTSSRSVRSPRSFAPRNSSRSNFGSQPQRRSGTSKDRSRVTNAPASRSEASVSNFSSSRSRPSSSRSLDRSRRFSPRSNSGPQRSAGRPSSSTGRSDYAPRSSSRRQYNFSSSGSRRSQSFRGGDRFRPESSRSVQRSFDTRQRQVAPRSPSRSRSAARSSGSRAPSVRGSRSVDRSSSGSSGHRSRGEGRSGSRRR